ncbi:peptidylprolyl isomerase [Candidatus Parcubacteria bacterium]|nr:peptidylprolyl isomerase [Patescibacteria group bacterium]MBU4309179.1 peptidylprolyl isomerase [Patescibacteria group bacterium]MBU4432702.1 peptidylprolyl isomerase [Patescibacteria group bacterium]MBU4577540.1 peptidylprolyl isomerase [Patescibacteria group bacterium]MCG2697227.1 peptidylprolyl isomerase [Candidatus Parcubacteria bacterium]
MKKYLLFIAIISLSLTGCTTKSVETVNEGNVPDNTANQTSDLKNDATSVEKTAQEDNTSSMDNNNQEDLAAEYQFAVIKTSKGDIKVKFYGEDSPATVNNFLNLAKKGFYDGIKFHRVIKDFMIQSGDPLSKDDGMKSRWGTGGPGYAFADEFNAHKLVKGSLAMANSGPNTNGSQFFIVTLDETPWLDGKHTNFGEVVEGMDVVMAIENSATEGPDRPVVDIAINGVELLK